MSCRLGDLSPGDCRRAEHLIRCIAFHEAGHAIAVLAVGGKLESVTAVMSGRVIYRLRLDEAFTLRSTLEDAFVALCGPVAEELVDDAAAAKPWPEHTMARNLLRAGGVAFDACEALARSFVAERRAVLDVLAGEITARCVLTGEEVTAIVLAVDPSLTGAQIDVARCLRQSTRESTLTPGREPMCDGGSHPRQGR